MGNTELKLLMCPDLISQFLFLSGDSTYKMVRGGGRLQRYGNGAAGPQFGGFV